MSNLEAQVRFLVERAQISDVLFAFARALDSKDWAAYVALYADDAVLELPDPRKGGYFTIPRSEMLQAVPKSLGRYAATHHISSNHQIEVNGERAASRSYLLAVHVRESPRDHWSVGGWYDNEYQRVGSDWRLTRVRVTAVWLGGEPGEIRPDT